MVPGWFWLESSLIWPLFVISLLLIVFFTFTLVTLIAALLRLSGGQGGRIPDGRPHDDREHSQEPPWTLPGYRVEVQKLRHHILPQALLLFIVSWIPGANHRWHAAWALVYAAWVIGHPPRATGPNNRIEFPADITPSLNW
ncbi:hypothetical protein DSL92_06960 [Billgrantia gudaonensis]|uniref:MAPEG family protein n=1 Tax=Billgrantia gudaonensis TaxID=376427 RepID=A0A3S0NWR5_9GAMM|nr:hypothetical protein DSL92_06960 [Halomonas gudaonensis]